MARRTAHHPKAAHRRGALGTGDLCRLSAMGARAAKRATPQFTVGMTYWAPARMPVGQRALVTL